MNEGMSGRDLCSNMKAAKCGGRWNPTSEQVKVLMDLFRSGLRTPTTDQIQCISTHLSTYGHIESKNVFYWFQNHKARDRQKRRRISTTPKQEHHLSSKHYMDAGGERSIETLQLFPLRSYEGSDGEKMGLIRNERMEMTLLGDVGKDFPQLDLRLSYF